MLFVVCGISIVILLFFYYYQGGYKESMINPPNILSIPSTQTSTISSSPSYLPIDNPPVPQDDFGFIITRHVNSSTTNKYWIHCIHCIRRHYKNKIIVIDDNSKSAYLKEPEEPFYNVEYIQSAFPGRGELLGYYYLYEKRFFKKAMIIHDSLFIKQYIDVNNIMDCKFLFHCDKHTWDDDAEITRCLTTLRNPSTLLTKYYEKQNWYLCFGVQSVITLDFLQRLQKNYNFFNLIECVTNRSKRMALERIYGFLCTLEKPELLTDPSIFGSIHSYMDWGYTYEQYINDMTHMNLGNYRYRQKLEKLKVVKVWTGR